MVEFLYKGSMKRISHKKRFNKEYGDEEVNFIPKKYLYK